MKIKLQKQQKENMRFDVRQNGETPEIRTNVFSVLEQGRFTPLQLRLHIQGERKRFASSLTDFIDASWEHAKKEAIQHGWTLFNGKLFSLLNHQVRQGSLNLLLGETDYKELLGTHFSIQEGQGSTEEAQLSNGIAVCTTLITEDNSIILGRRSQHVHTGRGLLHVCAGHPDPDQLLSVEEILAGENLFCSAMKKEIQEEFSIKEDEISNMVCLGLVRSMDHLKPEVIFKTYLEIPGREILQRYEYAKDRYEHQEIILIPSAQGELLAFLKEHYQDFTSPGLGAVIFHGREQGFWI
jgi:hypothetical protein